MRIRRVTVLAVCLAVGALLADMAPVEAASGKKQVVAKRSKVKVSYPAPSRDLDILRVQSAAVVVQDQSTGAVLFEKNSDAVVPIASITKLMTAMVVLDAGLPLEEMLAVGDEDIDTLRGSHSRLRVGTELSREDMLRLALMSSENRAASALGRHYPGGIEAFVAAMNVKALAIGLRDTHFSDSTGLSAANVSSARDLSKMVAAAAHYPLIRELSTTAEYTMQIGRRSQTFRNTNTLVRSSDWEIGLSKTGYIREAGKCLVMQAWLSNKPVIIVLLDSWGKLTRIGDAQRIKRWVEHVTSRASSPSAALDRAIAG
jgi:D-alanyl-D-alanine endopeptidase (penicillin-binding protein 7)